MALQKNQTNGQAGPTSATHLTNDEDAAKEAKRVRKEAKKKAFYFLKDVASAEGADPKIAQALKVIRPSLYGERSSCGGKTPTHALFVAKVVETGKEGLSEFDVFQEFKVGRKEARSLIKKHLKSTSPESRIWINFNPDAGLYRVVGKGSNPPQSYVGYIPVDDEEELA